MSDTHLQLHSGRIAGNISTPPHRIYLIGNGTSLKQTPKHLLTDKITMGCNKVGNWMIPSYYVKVDMSVFDGENTWREEIVPMVERGIPCLLWERFRDGITNPADGFHQWISNGIGDHPNVTWVERCKHHHYPPNHKDASRAWHEPFCTAYNSISVMTQWAVRLGYKEIVLIGCDLNFTNGIDDHFMKYYNRVDDNYVERNESHARAAHELIKKCCPVPVCNATIGGALEAYPRVDIHEMLRGG